MTNKPKKSASQLIHQVRLLGARAPYNIITIILDPQKILSGQNVFSVGLHAFCAKCTALYISLFGKLHSAGHNSTKKKSISKM